MTPSEVAPWPEPGQYWAMLRSLSLVRMADVKGEETALGHRWTPACDAEEILFVLPMRVGDFRYLWNTWRGPYASALTFVAGDVWLYQDPTGADRLFFIGPETTEKEVVIHADHPLHGFTLPVDATWRHTTLVFGTPPALHLFQPGHGRRVREARTSWDAIKGEGVV